MSKQISITQIEPTIFLKRDGNGLKHLVRVSVENTGCPCSAHIKAEYCGKTVECNLGEIPKGPGCKDIYIDEVPSEEQVRFTLMCGESIADERTLWIKSPRHWVVHVVQLSHHDPGYTDLPSVVLKDHYRWLDEAIDMAELSDNQEDGEDDAKFRIVVEQAWSLDHFMKTAPAGRVEKAVRLIKAGRFEVTALFGNMTTEICGHESLVRSLYHARRLSRRYGFDIVSAEHNDITGISWGLCRVLTDAGIKIFCPGIPLYYSWGNMNMTSFWDQEAVFRHGGPGAFWWEAPSGKKLLFWCNNTGCGGDCRGELPGLEREIINSTEKGYPYSVLRYPVSGGERDNSPYISGYADTIRQWNRKWAYPHLVCSTNARFYSDLAKQLPEDLPVRRGELAGQDYPAASTSTAAASSSNRNNHAGLLTSEKLASAASICTDYQYPDADLFEAYEDVLWHDEHAWGFHFPCGPAMKASEYEKAVHAYRAAAVAHGVTNKAMARIADDIKKACEDFHLVIFNSTQYERTGPVHALLREMDNSGSVMARVPPGEDGTGGGFLRGVLLNDRFHANPPMELVEGKFDLIDPETGKEVPYSIAEVDSPTDTVPYAAERLGIGSGTRRLGLFELPLGLKREIAFIAEDVPAFGYKTYRLRQKTDVPLSQSSVSGQCGSKYKNTEAAVIENEYYFVSVDKDTGAISSIFDKAAGRELVDINCPHGFNTLIVRDKDLNIFTMQCTGVQVRRHHPVFSCIEVAGTVHGHPVVKYTVSLYAKIPQIYFSTRILKDATPLLDAHIPFPFKVKTPRFRYEGTLSVMNPIHDYLPGSYSDTVAVQNWAKVGDQSISILWSPVDAAIVKFGGLWPGYVSPAHRCHMDLRTAHPPLKAEDLKNGWIYSQVFSNNYGTNFSVSQTGDMLFRYVIASHVENVGDIQAARFGWQAVTPFEQIFSRGSRKNMLPLKSSFMKVDNENVILLNFKKAEDGKGYIVRLWNMSGKQQRVVASMNYGKIAGAFLVDIAEADSGIEVEYTAREVILPIEANTLANIRVLLGA